MSNPSTFVLPPPFAMWALLLTLIALAPERGLAQHGSPSPEQSVAEKTQELAEALEQREREIEDLRQRVNAQNVGVAQDALRSELGEQEAKFQRQLTELVELLVERADSGGDDEHARAAATRALEADASRIRAMSRAANAAFLALADAIESGTPEEAAQARTDHDRGLSESDALLQEFHDNIELRGKLGLEVSTDTAAMSVHLKRRSLFVAGYLQSTKEEIDTLSGRAGIDKDVDAQQQLADLNDRRDALAESQRLNVELMEEYGMETAELREGIISATGKISQDVLDKDVAVGLIENWVADGVSWFRAHGPALAFQAVTALLIVLAFWIAARIGRGATRRALQRSRVKMSRLARDFFIKTTGRVIVLLGLIIAVAQLGVEVGPLLAGLGIAGFVIGFALQDTLSNFASGMMILVYRPFDVGDVIEAGGVMGKVDEMNLVSTMILTFDNQLLVVPNKQIWGGIIRNVTHQDTRRVDLTFGIGYSDDIPKAEQVLKEIVEGQELVLKDPAPVIRLHELGDSSVNFVVRPWSKTSDYWDVYWNITREVKRRFDEEGISIPFPQRDVHIHREPIPGPAAHGEKAQKSTTDVSAQDVAPADEEAES